MEYSVSEVFLINLIFPSNLNEYLHEILSNPSIKSLLDYGLEQIVSRDSSDAKNVLDALISICWTIAAGTLTLVGIFFAIFTISFQRQIEGVQNAFEEVSKLKKYNDSKNPVSNTTTNYETTREYIRDAFGAYKRKVDLLQDEKRLFWDNKWLMILVPVVTFWVSGIVFMVLRWGNYGYGNLHYFIPYSIVVFLIISLCIMIYFVRLCIRINNTILDKVLPAKALLDVQNVDAIPITEMMLDTVNFYASISTRPSKQLHITAIYALPFYNYNISLDFWILDSAKKVISRVPTDKYNSISKIYQEQHSFTNGGKDIFVFDLPSEAESIMINRIEYTSSSRYSGQIVFKSKGEISFENIIKAQNSLILDLNQLWILGPLLRETLENKNEGMVHILS